MKRASLVLTTSFFLLNSSALNLNNKSKANNKNQKTILS